jgi:ribosome biogenesis GTPase
MKATGGFYYVPRPEGGLIECRGRGIFRKEGRSPCVGDMVDVRPDGETGTIVDIHPRKNALIRPPLANIDYMVVVISLTDPEPNLYVTDKYLAILDHKDIEPVLALTKSDLADHEDIAALYEAAGFPVHVISSETGAGLGAFRERLAGKLCAFSGNSGVGKSSLLNALDARFAVEVGDTSKKLGRGRHTTRHVELFTLDDGTMIADTPGFSTVDITAMSGIDKESLAYCFRDMEPYLGQCRFVNCAHVREAGCAVIEALEDGAIMKSRHASYVQMYEEIKDIKEWEK